MDDALCINARVTALAQHLGDHTAGVATLRGILHNLDHHLVADPGAFGARVTHEDRHVQNVAIRPNERALQLAAQFAHEPALSALDDLNDAALVDHPAVPLAAFQHPGNYRIACDRTRSRRVTGWDEQVAVRIRYVRNDKAEPAWIGPEPADHLTGRIGQRQRAGRTHHDPAGLHQGLDGLAEIAVLLLRDAHRPGELADLLRAIALASQVADNPVREAFGWHGNSSAGRRDGRRRRDRVTRVAKFRRFAGLRTNRNHGTPEPGCSRRASHAGEGTCGTEDGAVHDAYGSASARVT